MEFYENHRDGMRRACAWRALDDRCLPHFHNSIELSLVTEGVVTMLIDGVEYDVHQGELSICSSFMIHANTTKNASRSIIAIIPLAPYPALQTELHWRRFAKVRLRAEEVPGELEPLMRMLADYGPAASSDTLPNGLGQAILGLLIERTGLIDAPRGSITQWLREVLEYLESNYASVLSVASLAARFGYSKSRFSHLFNEQLGCTLPDYINTLRCQHAAQLMDRASESSLLDVAMAVGFDCPRTFTRAFRKTFGVPPSRYRA